MVSAAELQALHQQHQQQQQLGASTAQGTPMTDPFPAVHDPFPAIPGAPIASAAAGNGSHGAFSAAASGAGASRNGSGTPGATSGDVNGQRRTDAAPQPDFDSQAAFPALGAPTSAAKGQWTKKPGSGQGAAPTWSATAPVIQRSMHHETFSIPSSEETSARIGQIIQRLQNRHKDIKIEASTTRKTNTTTFVIKGPAEAAVRAAKKDLSVGLARKVSLKIQVPASLRAFVIGAKGKNIKNITEQTGCRVNIPKSDDAEQHTSQLAKQAQGDVDYDADEQIEVSIEGDEINARQAKDMLMSIIAERTSRSTQRLTHIEHELYPFIAGARNSNIPNLEQGGDVSVMVPPRAAFLPAREVEGETAEPKRERDLSIIVSGDRDAVAKTVRVIETQVEEMRRAFRTLQINIPKRQHRFLVGDAAQDVLASTGCSVELTAVDDPSDTITIRGPQGQLPLALTEAIGKANAVRVEVVDVGIAHRNFDHAKILLRWLNVSGKLPREQNVQVYTPRPNVVESTGTAQIEIVGADANAVGGVRSRVDSLVKSVPPSFVLIMEIDPLVHRFVIGKKGSALAQYAKKGVDVVFPPPTSDAANGDARSDVALVLGNLAAIEQLPADKKQRDAAAQAILLQVKGDIEKASQQAADLKTETLNIPVKHHRAILGTGGTTLNAILGEERLAVVKLGSSSGNKVSSQEEDIVTIRGPSAEVARVSAAISKIAQEAEEDSIINGHTSEFSIESSHVPHIVGRGGAGVSKLREELGVRVDFGDANADITAKKPAKIKVSIVGRKENVEEAKKRILSQVEKLADETSVTLKVPANLHGAIIGQGGKYVTRLQDNYGVRINFPSQADAGKAGSQKSDEVVIKGGKKGVESAKAELLELIEYEKENNNVVIVPVSTKSVARIMGKGGSNINRLREETDAQIDVDRDDAQQSGNEITNIKLRGTKKAIAEAKAAIMATAADVDAEETYTVTIPAQHHGQIIGPGGQNLRDLITRLGGPSDARAAAQLIQFPRRGGSADQSDIVTVRGPADIASKMKAELEKIAHELSSRISIGVIVPQNSQRSLMGRVRELQSTHPSTRIIMPGWREYEQMQISNTSDVSAAAPGTVVKIQGSKDECEALRKEIADAFVSNSRALPVPRIIASRLASPNLFRRLREEYGVSTDAPRASGPAIGTEDAVRPSGPAGRIDDEEEDPESLPFESTSVDLAGSQDAMTWTLSGRSTSSLEEAVKDLEREIARMRNFTTQGRLWVDSRAIPRIVGRGGAGLRDIEATTESSIDIPRDAGGLVVILGTKDSVEEARERIARIALQKGRSA